MDAMELAEKLTDVGLHPDSAEVYVRLLQRGPAKAGTVAKGVDFSRSKTYRVLGELVDQGLAVASLESPTVYEARSPERYLATRLKHLEHERARLTKLRDGVEVHVARLVRESAADRDPHWKRVQGRPAIYGVLQRLLVEATESIRVLSNHGITTHAAPVTEDAWRTAMTRAREGLVVEALVRDVDGLRARHPMDVADAGVALRPLKVDRRIHLALVDDREILVWVHMDPSHASDAKGDVAIWSNAPGLVATHLELFDRLWRDAAVG